MNVAHNQDCIRAMRGMEDNQFDLAIVDPPYGIGNSWSKSRKDRFYREGELTTYRNDTIPPKRYFTELFRISRNQVIWGGNYFTKYLPAVNGWIVWNKMRDADITFMSEGEPAWTSFNKVLRIVEFMWDGAKKGKETHKPKIHPFQKPVVLYRWILLNYAAPGDKIIDTHLGSGSSRIAAHELDFDFVGYEIDESFFSAQEVRYNNHQRQLLLFNKNQHNEK